jgi:hypothetical protein
MAGEQNKALIYLMPRNGYGMTPAIPHSYPKPKGLLAFRETAFHAHLVWIGLGSSRCE